MNLAFRTIEDPQGFKVGRRVPRAIPKNSLKLIAKGTTSYHYWEVLHSSTFGRLLFINGDLQSSEFDQALYHKTLLDGVKQSAGHLLKSVLILGEGPGGLTKLFAEDGQITAITTVELDPELIYQIGPLLPQWHRGSFKDSRICRMAGDAVRHMEMSAERMYDAVIVDFTDPSYDICSPVLEVGFMKSILACLKEGGAIGVQSGPARDVDSRKRVKTCLNNAGFIHVHQKSVNIPSFNENWAFTFARRSNDAGF